jgi:restriction system protein
MFSILKGWIGEKETQLGMWAKLDSSTYKRFHNVIFPTVRGTTQVDHIVLSVYGVFVVETKSHNGWIFGSEKSSHWTQSLYGEKFRFQNPLHQNYSHTKAVADYLQIDHADVRSIIFFIGDNVELKTELPPNVMSRGLCAYIKSFQEKVFSESEVGTFVKKAKLLQDRQITNSEHVANLRRQYSCHTCPKCGKPLVIREYKKGPNIGTSFLGCAGFPECKFKKII